MRFQCTFRNYMHHFLWNNVYAARNQCGSNGFKLVIARAMETGWRQSKSSPGATHRPRITKGEHKHVYCTIHLVWQSPCLPFFCKKMAIIANLKTSYLNTISCFFCRNIARKPSKQPLLPLEKKIRFKKRIQSEY